MPRTSRQTADAASATGLEAARAAVEQPTPGARGAGSGDPLIGDLRRAGLLPLLVLHFTARAPAYGNQLTDKERWAIVAYIRTLEGAQYAPPQPATPAPEGTP